MDRTTYTVSDWRDFLEVATPAERQENLAWMRQQFDRFMATDPALEPPKLTAQRARSGPEPHDVPNHLAGPILRALRLSLGLSTWDVRERTGVSRGTLDRIEFDRHLVEVAPNTLTKNGAAKKRCSPYLGTRERLLAYYEGLTDHNQIHGF